MDALLAAAEWLRGAGIPLVLKEHPANRASAAQYREALSAYDIYWSDANVLDLAKYSTGVVTLNSGVGFEAILLGKPVVTFARVEYDAVTHHATPATFGRAWKSAMAEDADARMTRYARFVDWFLARYAVDLSRPQAAQQRLYKIVSDAIAVVAERENG
jgi:capsule polysaccharide modification protein KpsS